MATNRITSTDVTDKRSISVLVEKTSEAWSLLVSENALLVTNNQPIELGLMSREPDNADIFYTRPVDIGLRLATPDGYAILITQTCSSQDPSQAVSIISGVIDSGYRGILKALIYHRPCIETIKEYGLKLQLPLLKLSKATITLAPCPATIRHKQGVPMGARLCDFYEIFKQKRDEDAGYDISAPETFQIYPGFNHYVEIPVVHLPGDNPPIACIFGRSSLNVSGIVVLPTVWKPETKCGFFIKNMRRDPVIIRAGQRIAQLLLLEELPMEWLPTETNNHDPFPETPEPAPGTIMAHADLWTFTENFDRDAPSSLRGDKGFGSTGV